jgi:hypothetical protein
MNENTFEDAFNLLCGEKIGEGLHRQVFACSIRPDLVVKVEDAWTRHFANVLEQKFWDDHQYVPKIVDWLAPCEFLSPDGRILLQKRCDPVPSNYKMPVRLPSFLTDLKRSNFGFLHGRLVCFDYEMSITNPSFRLRKVEFRT